MGSGEAKRFYLLSVGPEICRRTVDVALSLEIPIELLKRLQGEDERRRLTVDEVVAEFAERLPAAQQRIEEEAELHRHWKVNRWSLGS